VHAEVTFICETINPRNEKAERPYFMRVCAMTSSSTDGRLGWVGLHMEVK